MCAFFFKGGCLYSDGSDPLRARCSGCISGVSALEGLHGMRFSSH